MKIYGSIGSLFEILQKAKENAGRIFRTAAAVAAANGGSGGGSVLLTNHTIRAMGG
jgi:hypothetical protein